MDNGVNYIDLVFNIPEILEGVRKGIRGSREDVNLVFHLGSTVHKGDYKKTRDMKDIKKQFQNTLDTLNTDYIDVANLHYIKKMDEYDEVTSNRNALDLAEEMVKEKKAKLICISTHEPSVAIKTAKSGGFDLIMMQVNLSNNAMPQRDEMLRTCAQENVGVVAMKPYAGGKLLQQNRTVRIAQYQRAGDALKRKIPKTITPVMCLHYILSQVGVKTVVPGVKNIEELDNALSYFDASDEEKDYSSVLQEFGEYQKGVCVYCNHCLPCPSVIDIGRMNRLLDMSKPKLTGSIKEEYNSLNAKASDCIVCSKCEKRCPFEVEVILRMKEAEKVFGD